MNKEFRDLLSDAVDRIDRPGSFCTSGSAQTVLPGLEVKGLGPIAIPFTPLQAEALIKLCQQAPYGKGEKTLVDRDVRRVWRMAPARVSLTNPDWQPFVDSIVRRVQDALGLESQKLESHLYDLLVYEPGSFFLPHRDSEKLDRMVATLIVVLPSKYEGGELIVRHENHKETIHFRGPNDNPFDTYYAAFYADCEHEVRPLKKGHRLCLVYNLILAKSKKKQAAITAPRESEPLDRISRLLEEWVTDTGGEATEKLVITLEHQYTKAGLSWDALKGVDRTRAKILDRAARQADCKVYLALLTLHDSGSAEYVGDGGGYRSSRWGEYDESDDASEYEMEEIFESELTADSWSDSEGHTLPIGALSISENELLDPEMLREVTPEAEFEGYTGNAGMTLDHWYRHASIIIWSTRRHFEILCGRDGRRVVPELVRMVASLSRHKASSATALRTQCLELARAIIKTWSKVDYGGLADEDSKQPDLLKTLDALGDPSLIESYFRDLLTRDVTLDVGKSAATVCAKHGWATFQNAIRATMAASSPQTLARNVRLLEQICSAKPRNKQGWPELCEQLASTLVTATKSLSKKKSEPEWRTTKIRWAEVLAGLVRSLILTGQTDLLNEAVAHAMATPKSFPITTTQMSALSQLRPWLDKQLKQPNQAVTHWLAECREQLETLTAREPEKPTDFRRSTAVGCKCADCAELKRFLGNAKEATHQFKVRQDRRNHLELIIKKSRCDLDFETDRSSSPHALVCTKNFASYQQKVKEFQQNQEHLAMVRAISAGLPT